MMQHTRLGRRMAGLATGAALVAGSLIGAAAPAAAYSPDPGVKTYTPSTSSSVYLSDPFDDTYFKQDKGGEAVKIELRDNGWYVGKVEFHPYGEKLWVYDTKNDGDTIYVRVKYYVGDPDYPKPSTLGPYSVNGTSSVVDKNVIDLGFDEGEYIRIDVYDDRAMTDWIGGASGNA